jgi:hypothetical protein
VDALTAFADATATWAASYLLAFAAIGALTMALIQTIKELTPAREWFHNRALERWVSRSVKADKSGRAVSCIEELIALSTAGDRQALCSLEIERLAGLLASVGAVVVDFPIRHEALLRHLAAHADPKDIKSLLAMDDGGRAHMEAMRQHDRPRFDAFLDGKARVTHLIQRNIDAFQISTGFRWKWTLQVASFVISFIFATVALMYADDQPNFDWTTFGRSIPLALAAGFFAPIARDLVAVVDKARR